MASAAAFRWRVLVALGNVPLHARSVATVQVVLGMCCSDIAVSDLRDTPVDDDREFFVTAWCWDPAFITGQQPIFIPEPRFEALGSAAPGLRYLVRIRLVASQDCSTPPASPPRGASTSDDEGGGDVGGGTSEDFWPTPRRNSEVDDSDDSNCNGRHPGFDCRSIQVGSIACPLLRRPLQRLGGAASEHPPVVSVLELPQQLLPTRREFSPAWMGFVNSFLEVAPYLRHGGFSPRAAPSASTSAGTVEWWATSIAEGEISLPAVASGALLPRGRLTAEIVRQVRTGGPATWRMGSCRKPLQEQV